MGDMKTPDFDDLLAAFDIPDIDAKEAIQSSPEEERDQLGTNVGHRRSGSPPCFPPAAPHSEPPVVSVIVKNTVRSESVDEEDKSVRDKADNPASGALVSQVGVKLDDLTSQLTPKLASAAGLEPQLSNGFEEPVTSHQQQARTESWSRALPLRPLLDDKRDESQTVTEPGSIQHTSDVMNSFRPLLYPEPPTAAGPTSSPPSSPLPVGSHNSPHVSSPLKDEGHLQNNPSSSPLPQNRNTEISEQLLTDEDSEPDIEGPLVIQESPESSPPILKRRDKLHSDLLGSPSTTASHVSPPPLPKLTFSMAPTNPESNRQEDGGPVLSNALPSACETLCSPEQLPTVSTNAALVQEDEYPDRIIEERDSPESPPPYETGLLATSRSNGSDSGQTPGLTVNYKELSQQEEPMETSQEGHPSGIELNEKVSGDGEILNEPNCDADSEDAPSADVSDTGSTPVRPIKVTIKVPTSSNSRTGVAPKRGGRATSKSVDGSKRSPRSQNTRSKKQLLQQSQLPAVALLQDACAATLQGANAVKERKSVKRKPKVSPTAVSITKTVSLPSVSSSRVTSGAISLRNLGQKTLNSGISLPAPLPLLPPQTNSRPASIVNNTGAIISKSQTNLVEAFNKILNNKNLLPSYKPDLSIPLPAEWDLPLPAQGYRCLECGDAFALERSLTQHYDRRSLRIEVTCNHCTKRLAFFNKCSLLLHAREHKEKGLIMQCSHLVMKPVPVEQMISQPEPAAAEPAGQNNAKPAGPAHQAVPSKKAEAVQSNKNRCSECQLQFSSKEEVAEHFQEIKLAHSNSCSECYPPMLLPNNCSAAAHQRIHQASAPHVCPECGDTFKQSVFQTHLSEDCLHFSRRIGYRCSSCLVVFGGLNSVKAHIQQAHCDLFHKCPSCPMAFKSAPSTQNHINAQHPQLTDKQTLLIYKCVMCDTVFTHKPLLHVHFDSHLVNQKVHVFKCPDCTKLFSQRSSLLDHSKTHRTAAPKLPSPPPRSAVKLESSDEESMNEESQENVKSVKVAAPSGWTCQSCRTRYRAREDYISHMREKHDQILKKYPCNKCGSSFSNNSNMMRHMRDKHTVISRGFRCQFCTDDKKTFSSRAMLDRHVLLRHTVDAVGQDAAQGVKEEAEASAEQDGSAGICSKRPREAVKKKPDEDSSAKKSRSSAPSQSVAPQPPHDSGFRCAPCGFTTEEQAAFLEHIGQHSGAEGAALQCLQCGACFASSSSLSRHRFITHKVKGVMADGQHAAGARSPGSSRNHKDKSSVNGSAPASPFSQPAAGLGSEEDGALGCKAL
ncbi:zinc finger protein 687a isoform X2 [Salarias fasciatus]|uniref:zinc finger protein 687a isoform X2 n=1 Tax=Salarias fasciatus TaxID=181472 RepID=UPI001176EB1D|nr:zinc finger protein 687b-like isoform X2 [Salarias fasciatus]